MQQEMLGQRIYGYLQTFSNDTSRPIQTDDLYVYITDMPVNEAVLPCDVYGYTIYINAKLSPEGREKAMRHALWHIQNGDFERFDVQEIEEEAHAQA